MLSFLLLCTQTWEEGAAGEVAGAGSPCRTCPQRCQVQARRSASRERLVECHPLQHWNLSSPLPALPLTLLGFSHPVPLPIYTLPVPLKHLSILPQKKMSRDLVLLLSLLALSFPCIDLCSFTSLWQSLPSLPLQSFSVSKLFPVGLEVKIQLEMIKSTGLAICTPKDHPTVRHERERDRHHKGIFSPSLSHEF